MHSDEQSLVRHPVESVYATEIVAYCADTEATSAATATRARQILDGMLKLSLSRKCCTCVWFVLCLWSPY
jgi:hypothetical protein